MTVEEKVANLTTSVDQLTDAVNVKKQTLDASVADGVSARDQSQGYRDEARTARDESQSHANTALGYSQDAASAVAYQDLTSIAETKAETAVDVFVYDTSQDSDGGAWRHRTQHTSWYNEPLNTATRGARREFPAVAVIVAEADTVTIYDGDDPALPIWKVLNSQANDPPGGYAAAFWMGPSSTRQATSICALDGTLSLTARSDTAGNGIGLFTANLISDKLVRHSASTANSGIWQGTFADLSDPEGIPITIGTAEPLANNNANDAAVTVLPDAPFDQATGLPVPTIAVATDGGTSVILDDGTVHDSTHSAATTRVSFSGDGTLYAMQETSGARVYVYEKYADTDGFPLSFDYIANDNPAFLKPGKPLETSVDREILFEEQNRGGLARIKEKPGDFRGGLTSRTTSTYNTGWMPGDIKGAFLSDTDDTDLVGSGELVTNGTFDSDTSGWDIFAGTLAYDSARSALEVQGDGASYVGYPIPGIIEGETYVIEFELLDDAVTSSFGLGSGNTNLADAISTPGPGNRPAGVYRGTVVASAGVDRFLLVHGGGNSQTFSIDNVSVKLADADRSVNNNGLIANGTVTREPVATGADLVAYSGFASSNFLEQPYNPDLDFGTGDFCVMGWVRASSGDFTLFYRALDRSNPSPPLGINVWIYNGIVKANLDSVRVTRNNIESLSSGEWHFVTLVRKGDAVFTFVDGKIINTDVGNGALSVGGAGHALSVGDGYYDNSTTVNALALLRIGATAPTPEQIKRIYEDEKVLFQENAQATLYGSSDAVTALAHDPVTDLLHVGTSDGRSVFKGLRRVDNTETPVGTAISAVNGLIVED